MILFLFMSEVKDFLSYPCDSRLKVLTSSLESYRQLDQDRKPAGRSVGAGRRGRHHSSPSYSNSRSLRSSSSSVSRVVCKIDLLIHAQSPYVLLRKACTFNIRSKLFNTFLSSIFALHIFVPPSSSRCLDSRISFCCIFS